MFKYALLLLPLIVSGCSSFAVNGNAITIHNETGTVTATSTSQTDKQWQWDKNVDTDAGQ